MPALDPEVNRQTSPEEKEREKFDEDFAVLMTDARFRRVLWCLVDGKGWCNAHSSPLEPASVNETFRLGGRQDIGILLRSTAQRLAPKLYLSMLKEAVDLRMQRAALSPPPDPQK